MFEVSVVYLLRESETGLQVLLGAKKTGLGIGKLVGPGGKLEPGESAAEAAAREVAEEIDVIVGAENLLAIAELSYEFPFHPSWSQRSSAFVCRDWVGEPSESAELAPDWYPVDAIPFERMWDDAKLWLPDALSGTFVQATCSYGPDNDSVDQFTVVA
jgi:8-oxo-dGTP diphosphatase